jgi:hypothetical protein
MKRGLKSGNSRYHLAQSVLSSHLLPKNLQMRKYNDLFFLGNWYGCETWSLTGREEHRLRVLENCVLKRMFRLKVCEVSGSWRKLHNEELHNLFSGPRVIRMTKKTRMASHVASV